METKEFDAGEIVFNEGDESREAFRIVSGKIEISVRTPEGLRSVAQLREGEIFGEMGLVDDKPRSATATALEKTALGVISAENFSDTVLRDEAELTRYVATLTERLRTTNALLEIALRQNENENQAKAGAPAATGTRSFELALGHDAQVDAPPQTAAYSEYRVLLASAYEPGNWRGDEIAVEIANFPFRIGCQFVGPPPPFLRNDLLVRDTLPGYISRDHCAIERNANTIFVRDRGSVAGTIVNGQGLGTQAGTITAPLNLGENVLVLGGTDSPHRFFLHVVPVE